MQNVCDERVEAVTTDEGPIATGCGLGPDSPQCEEAYSRNVDVIAVKEAVEGQLLAHLVNKFMIKPSLA